MLFTFCGGLSVILAAVDLAVKQYIEDTYQTGEEHKTALPGIRIRKVYNTGFAFNLFDRYPELIRRSSVIAGIGVLFCDIFSFLKKGRHVLKIGMTFVTAGAFSNLYDRLVRGKVIDYIGVKNRNTFLSKMTANLADVYVVTGMMMVSLSRMVHRKKKDLK